MKTEQSFVRSFEMFGYTIDVHRFAGKCYFYPRVGDMEYRVSAAGFRQLSRRLRGIEYFSRLLDPVVRKAFTQLFLR